MGKRVLSMGVALLLASPLWAASPKRGTLEVTHAESHGPERGGSTSLSLTLLPRNSVSFQGYVQQAQRANGDTLTMRSGVTVGKALTLAGGYIKAPTGESTEVRLGLRMGHGQFQGSRASSQTGRVNYDLSYRHAEGDRVSVLLDAKAVEQPTAPTDIQGTATVKVAF